MAQISGMLRISILCFLILVIPGCSQNPSSGSSSGTNSSEVQAEGRDLLMEQGASFMAVVTEHKERLKENPRDKTSLLFLGNANYDISRFERAKEYYHRYLEIDPDHIGARTDMATSYFNMKETDAAIRELRTVLKQAPEHEAALFNLGLILAGNDLDREGAIQAWERLLLTHPDHAKAEEVRRQIEEMKKAS